MSKKVKVFKNAEKCQNCHFRNPVKYPPFIFFKNSFSAPIEMSSNKNLGSFLMRYVTHSQTSFPWTEDKQDPARVLFHHVFVTASLDFAPLSSGFIASHRVELWLPWFICIGFNVSKYFPWNSVCRCRVLGCVYMFKMFIDLFLPLYTSMHTHDEFPCIMVTLADFIVEQSR